jgi:MFS family permease
MQLAITDPKRIFLLVWSSQFISALGTGLTNFALGVFVYQKTGSTTQFALVLVCAMIPAILLSPFSGALGDRGDRRRMMLYSNAASAVVILGMLLLREQDALRSWHIYVGAGLLAVCGAFRDPAYYASVSQMVPKKQLGRASGLVQTAENIGIVAPPMIAGILLATVGLSGVLVIDFISFLIGIGALLVTVFPPVDRSDEEVAKSSLWRDMTAGWSYLTRYRGFLYLFLFGSFISFAVGVTQIVVTPLVLSFASTTVLGFTFSAGGLGILLGGLAMAAWGGPKRRVVGVLLFGALQGLSLVVAGLRSEAVLIGVGLFGCLFCIQFVRGCTAVIIREHVPDAMQARVFSLNRFVAWSTLPLAYLLAGPLVDAFTPLLQPSGSLADSVGTVLGVGDGRGIGLLLTVLGAAFLLVVLASLANPRLRNVEAEMRAVHGPEEHVGPDDVRPDAVGAAVSTGGDAVPDEPVPAEVPASGGRKDVRA